MKKINAIGFTFLILIISLIISCQKDDEPVDPIVGTWEYVEASEDFSRTVTLAFYEDKSGLSTVTYLVYGEPDKRNNNFIYSTKNGILTLIVGFDITDSPYSIAENQLTTTYLGEILVFYTEVI